jgi:hypothetical protein
VGGILQTALGYHRAVPNLSVKASETDDPGEMVRRIAYRNRRIITRVDGHEDPAKFAKRLAGHTRADIRRLAELLGVELDESGWS